MRYTSTFCYIALILIINICFSYLPGIDFGSNRISIADIMVGFIYLARDFSQREIGHYVLAAMAIGATLSYALADPNIANASIAAFVVAEAVDWGIFTLTGWPLSQRLLLSAGISAPIDSFIFLQVAHLFNGLEFSVMTLAKWVGVIALWWSWRWRQQLRNNLLSKKAVSIH